MYIVVGMQRISKCIIFSQKNIEIKCLLSLELRRMVFMNLFGNSPVKKGDIQYYPALEQLKRMAVQTEKIDENILLLQPGKIAPTIGYNPKFSDGLADKLRKSYVKAKNIQKRKMYSNMLLRGISLLDLTTDSYERRNMNPNNMSYWLRPLKDGISSVDSELIIPKTEIYHMPIEMSQLLQHDWKTETNQKTRDLLNNILFDSFKLDENKEYFIKLGNFSSKFEFANAHIDDPKSIGDYFNVIANFAQMVNADLTNELVVRQWIPNYDNRPTIYDGMPLRTEFRCFVDFDLDDFIAIVPYWDPQLMRKTLRKHAQTFGGNFERDIRVYEQIEDELMQDYNDSVNAVKQMVKSIIPHIKLHGRWALDIMKTQNKYYAIDMQLMDDSALQSLIPKETLDNNLKKRSDNGYPRRQPFETDWYTKPLPSKRSHNALA